VLNSEPINYLTYVLSNICCDLGATLMQCNGQDGHVHLLAECPPKMPITTLVNSLKEVCARRPSPAIPGPHPPRAPMVHCHLAASCGGAPQAIINQYLEQQRTSA
jgi:putative transposase